MLIGTARCLALPNLQEALPSFNKFQEKNEAELKQWEEIKALKASISELIYKKNYEQAVEDLKKLIPLSAPYPYAEILNTLYLGDLSTQLKNKEEAIEAYKTGISKYEKFLNQNYSVEFEKSFIKTCRVVGSYIEKYGDYQEAIKIYRKGLQSSRNIKDTGYEKLLLGDLAIIHGENGLYKEAIDFGSQNEKLSKGDDKALLDIYNGMSYRYAKMGESSKATKYLKKGEKLAIKLDNQAILASIYDNYGENYYSDKQYELAEEYFQKASNILMVTKKSEAIFYKNLGKTKIKLNKPQEACLSLDKAERIFRALDLKLFIDETLGYSQEAKCKSTPEAKAPSEEPTTED